MSELLVCSVLEDLQILTVAVIEKNDDSNTDSSDDTNQWCLNYTYVACKKTFTVWQQLWWERKTMTQIQTCLMRQTSDVWTACMQCVRRPSEFNSCCDRRGHQWYRQLPSYTVRLWWKKETLTNQCHLSSCVCVCRHSWVDCRYDRREK